MDPDILAILTLQSGMFIITLLRGLIETYYERQAVKLLERQLNFQEEDKAPWSAIA